MAQTIERIVLGLAVIAAVVFGVMYFTRGDQPASAGYARATTGDVDTRKAKAQGKFIKDGPKQRGDAEAYCFKKYPHWPKVIADFEKTGKSCELVTAHGPTATKCQLDC